MVYARFQMKGNMNTADPSRFSHITIGQGADVSESPEEEIELIGAVELVGATKSPRESGKIVSSVIEAAKDPSGSSDCEDHKSEPSSKSLPESSSQQDVGPDDTIDKDEQPMLTARKITLVLCGLGVIAAAAYIMDYWGIINLPF